MVRRRRRWTSQRQVVSRRTSLGRGRGWPRSRGLRAHRGPAPWSAGGGVLGSIPQAYGSLLAESKDLLGQISELVAHTVPPGRPHGPARSSMPAP